MYTKQEKSFTVQDIIKGSKNSSELQSNIKNFFDFHFYQNKNYTKRSCRMQKLTKIFNPELSGNDLDLHLFFSLKFYLFSGLEDFKGTNYKNIIKIFESFITYCNFLVDLNSIQKLIPKQTFRNEIIILLSIFQEYYKKVIYFIVFGFCDKGYNIVKLQLTKVHIEKLFKQLVIKIPKHEFISKVVI